MGNTRKLAQEVVSIVNKCTNDYDAIEQVEDHINKFENMDSIKFPSGKKIVIALIVVAVVLIAIGFGIAQLF